MVQYLQALGAIALTLLILIWLGTSIIVAAVFAWMFKEGKTAYRQFRKDAEQQRINRTLRSIK